MTKIIIINCIIAAVYIFQTAEAGLLDKPLGSLLDKISTVQNQVSSTVENIKERIQNGTEDKLTDGLITPQTGLSTSISTCTNAHNIIREAVEQVNKTFNACIMQTTNSATIEQFTTTLNNLQKSVLKILQEASNCTSSLSSPSNMISCFSKVINNILELPIDNIMNVTTAAIGSASDMRKCFETGIQQLHNPFVSQIVQNLGQCLQSLGLSFKL